MEALKKREGILSNEVDMILSAAPGDLNILYDRMLRGMDGNRLATINTVLKWLLSSHRLLFIEEALELCKLDFQQGFLLQDDEEITPAWLMQSLKDLIKVVPAVEKWDRLPQQRHAIDWAHFSVKEYLTSQTYASVDLDPFRLEIEAAHFYVAKCCLAYLLCTNTFDKRSGHFPLRRYAWDYWRKHAELAGPHSLAKLEQELTTISSGQRKANRSARTEVEKTVACIREIPSNLLEWMDKPDFAHLPEALTLPFFFEEYDPGPLYTKLDGDTVTRLLEIKPSHDAELEVCCRLTPMVSDQIIDYEALSHVWGRRESVPGVRINGKLVEINYRLAKILRSLRYAHSSRWLWVDAICINQSDHREKSIEINALPEIFQNASQVTVHLSHDDDQNLAYEIINCMVQMKRSNGAMLNDDCLLQICESLNVLMEAEIWRALASLFENGWWHRAWTVQDVARCQVVRLLLGNRTISLDDIGFVLEDTYLQRRLDENAFESNVLVPTWKLAYGTTTIRKNIAMGAMKFPEVIYLTRFHESSYSADIIWSKCGLVPFVEGGLHRSDYNMSAHEVFRDFSGAILTGSKCLDLFSHIYTREGPDSLPWPSWVSKFHTRLATPIPFIEGIFGGPQAHDVFCAAARADEAIFHIRDDTLIIKGIRVDTIVLVGDLMTGKTWDEIPKQRERLFGQSKGARSEHESPADIESLWRTALADQWSIGVRISQDSGAFQSLPTTISSETAWLSRLGLPKSYHYRTDRVLCRTAEGRLGLVPEYANEGDLVVICPGGKVPYVLRESMMSDYRLIGER